MTTSLLTPSALAAVRRSDELETRIARAPGDFRVLSGDRPTGALHLGHYVGTLRNRVRLQNLGVCVTVLVADYQVLTDRANGPHLRETVRGLVLDYLAAGIDPSRSMIFAHSAVPALNQLMLPFLSLVSDAELHRNPTVRAETEATGRGPNALMLTYPFTRRPTSCSARPTWCRSGWTSCLIWRWPASSPDGSASATASTSSPNPRPCSRRPRSSPVWTGRR